jgi:ATP-dependent DNA helicase
MHLDIPDNLSLEEQAAARAARLTFLLDKSTIYAKIIGDRMERQQIEKRKAEHRAEVLKANREKRGNPHATRDGLRHKHEETDDAVDVGAKRKRKSEGGKAENKIKVEEVSGVCGRSG